MAHLLGAESIRLEYPTRVVFDDVTIGISEGDRIGVVGRNGDGKSTLLGLLSGRREPDGGKVTRRGGVTIGMLDQSDTLDGELTVGFAVVGDAQEHEWASNAIIRDVLAGLLGDIDWHARISTLSGGQRRRVALAALLAGDWDVIFLDEPTNHLDVEGIAWLAAHLKNRWPANQGGLVVVTHDRWFLDEVCNTTWEVHDRIIEPFEGGYAAYILQRVERHRSAADSQATRQNLMRKELAWLRRGAPARTAKPKFRIDAANELIANEPPPRNPVELASMAMQRLGKDVVDLENVGVVYDDRTILSDVTWRIAPGERTGVLGVNGAGKSTLLGMVAGTVTPTSGRIKRGKTVKIAVLSQELAELAEFSDDRVSAVIARKRTSYVAGGKEITPAQLLERLGFTSAQLSTHVKDLSGGQKRRLQLLMILLDEPNVLILDEPTNDLDTDMLVAMEDLLDTWPGTLLVVSHDRYLLERITDNQFAVLDGHFRHLTRGVDQYLELRAASKKAGGGSSGGSGGGATAPKVARVPALTGADLRNAEKEVAAIDRKIAKLQDDIARGHEALASHDQSDFTGLAELTALARRLADEVVTLESRWLELSEQIEASR